jgi:hypothetical protein
MTTTGFLRLEGMEKWLEDIAMAGADIDEVVGHSILEGAKPIHREMVALSPGPRTHNLEKHIRIVGPEGEGNFIYVMVGVIHDERYTDPYTARYANAEEYGWTSGGKHHPGTSYIRAGWDNRIGEAMSIIKRLLKEAGKI